MSSDRMRWEALAKLEPYYSVLSERRFLASEMTADARLAFFESGDAYVDHLLRMGREELPGAKPVQRVLEFGCGPGRLAIAFARRGLQVTAVDISPTMLAIARTNAIEQNVEGIEVQVQDDFFESDGEFDLITLQFVLQHLKPSSGLRLLKRVLARLARGGTVHIHVPFQTSRSGRARMLSTVRTHLPGANAIANRLRGRPGHAPYLAPHVYSLNDILSLLREAGVAPKATRLSVENELEVAVISAVRIASESSRASRESHQPPIAGEVRATDSLPSDMVDVHRMIRETSIETLNERAEQYFAGLTSWDAQLAKPFATASDAPPMLTNLAVLIEGMRLVRGLTIVDFGAGTGWLARILAQLGARVILLDVSRTALRIAEERFRLAPPVGEHRPPEFLLYDGRKIDLPDQSVDRIICFDAFHHSPNPDDVLREFARILVPGGVAAFGEPGPAHSRTPQSQFEMRAYGVVENDIDIHSIWSLARTIGFARMRVAAFSGVPLFLSPDEFEDLLGGGAGVPRLGESARQFLANARTFFLDKEGTATIDSRTASALSCRIEVSLDEAAVAGKPVRLRATVTNTGRAVWLPSDAGAGGVSLGCHLYAGGQLVSLDYHWQPLQTGLMPGQTEEIRFSAPALSAGEFELELDCVARDVAWFGQVDAASTVRLRVIVGEI